MPIVFWDASALIKRYLTETGSQSVNAIFAAPQKMEMVTTPSGYTETYAALLRKRNGGVLNQSEFGTAVIALQDEVIHNVDFGLISVSDEIIFASIEIIHRHNLNSTDAALLTALLEVSQSSGISTCVLVASDQRLLRATAAEGLATLNPEHILPNGVEAALALL